MDDFLKLLPTVLQGWLYFLKEYFTTLSSSDKIYECADEAITKNATLNLSIIQYWTHFIQGKSHRIHFSTDFRIFKQWCIIMCIFSTICTYFPKQQIYRLFSSHVLVNLQPPPSSYTLIKLGWCIWINNKVFWEEDMMQSFFKVMW